MSAYGSAAYGTGAAPGDSRARITQALMNIQYPPPRQPGAQPAGLSSPGGFAPLSFGAQPAMGQPPPPLMPSAPPTIAPEIPPGSMTPSPSGPAPVGGQTAPGPIGFNQQPGMMPRY